MTGKAPSHKKILSFIPLYFIIISAIFASALLLHVLCTVYTPLADLVSKYVCTPVRSLLASLGSFFNFSILTNFIFMI